MTIVIDGTGLTVEKLTLIARQGEKVELHPEALERIKACRMMLESKIAAHEIMYGTSSHQSWQGIELPLKGQSQ